MAEQFKKICNGAIISGGNIHFERAATVDTNVPESYENCWDISATEQDSVYAYLVALGDDKYAIHIYGYGKMKDYDFITAEPYGNTPWIDYLFPNGAKNNSKISEVHIHSGVLNVGDNAFSGSSFLEEHNSKVMQVISIADSVRSIGMFAFRKNLAAAFTVPSGVREIRFGAFDSVDKTFNPDLIIPASKSITVSIPNSITRADYNPFRGSVLTGSVKTQNGFTIVSDKCAISYSGAPTILTVPSGIECLNLYGCDCLKTIRQIILPNSLKIISTCGLREITNITSLNLPSGTRILGSRAFENCTSLTSIRLNDGLEELESKVFVNTALKHIFIPSSVTSIAEKLEPSNRVNSALQSPFYNCPTTLKIYCEREYKPEGWSEYWNYVTDTQTATVYWGISREQYEAAVG